MIADVVGVLHNSSPQVYGAHLRKWAPARYAVRAGRQHKSLLSVETGTRFENRQSRRMTDGLAGGQL
jgi:hypothetical protein